MSCVLIHFKLYGLELNRRCKKWITEEHLIVYYYLGQGEDSQPGLV